MIDNKNINPFLGSDAEFKRKLTEEITAIDDVQPIEIVNVEDDTGPFPKIELPEMKIEQTPQVTEQMEHFENFEQTPEEIAELEKMIREDRMNELRKLAHSAGLRHEKYNLINKEFERQLLQHPTKNITEKQFDNKTEDYPKVLMINELVDWEYSQNNLISQPYTQPLYQRGAMEDDFEVRYHLNQIRSYNNPNPMSIQVNNVDDDDDNDDEPNMLYVPIDIIGAFRYVLNKERNISSTCAIKI
jgi:hypothetical protein